MLSLSRAITLVESRKPEHRQAAIELIGALYEERKGGIRLGITGIPGVGKSTFIERLGMHILETGHKLAVLAIDPSSGKSSGSILGDKTRMEELSRSKNAFIRPSPSGGTLGGVAARTRESMLLCEAAGFDMVIVETVGVGQSETEVINITDCFLMLCMPGTGDELQGMKRGIMEAADIFVINKADGQYKESARKAKKQMELALHLFQQAESGWNPVVKLASAMHNEGIAETWQAITEMHRTVRENGWLWSNRKLQQERAFQKLIELNIYERVMQRLGNTGEIQSLLDKVRAGEMNEYRASLEVMKSLKIN